MALRADACSLGKLAVLILTVLILLVLASQPGAAQETTVRIRVFSLYHPRELRAGAAPGCSLPGRRSGTILTVRLQAGQLEVSDSAEPNADPNQTSVLRIAANCPGKPPSDASLWLEVPGKLHRSYQGTLEIRPRGQTLEAVVNMPLETAVASVVAAESFPLSSADSSREALKAQAIAARSFLVARQAGHIGFDFCDTTHCQFLRSPPSSDSPAAEAARSTQGLILTWHDAATAQDQPLAAMYARSCGGRTRTLREIGLPVKGYPYYAVHCRYCTRHPELWRRERPATPSSTERDRLLYNRIHGWAALPSLPGRFDTESGAVEGRGTGHGLGLCQLGAADMASHGTEFRQILAHYYPNTQLESFRNPTQRPLN